MSTVSKRVNFSEQSAMRTKVLIDLVESSKQYLKDNFPDDGLDIVMEKIPGRPVLSVALIENGKREPSVNISCAGFHHVGPRNRQTAVPIIQVNTNLGALCIGKHPRCLVGILQASPIDADDAPIPHPVVVKNEDSD